MKTLEQLLTSLYTEKAISSWDQPIARIFPVAEGGRFLYVKELIERLYRATVYKDSQSIHFLCLVAKTDGVDHRYTNVFCELLQEDWHQSHTAIVRMLEEIKDPFSVDAIYETALAATEGNDQRALNIQCIRALVAINTKTSWEKLQRLSQSEKPSPSIF